MWEDFQGELQIPGFLTAKNLCFTIWLLTFLIWFLYAIIDLLIRIRNFLTKGELELVWFKYIEYYLLITLLVILVKWL